jgi:amidase
MPPAIKQPPFGARFSPERASFCGECSGFAAGVEALAGSLPNNARLKLRLRESPRFCAILVFTLFVGKRPFSDYHSSMNTIPPQQLEGLDALELANLVKNGDVQPSELLETAVTRAEKVNPQLNAIVTPMFELAREATRQEIPAGKFAGVPFLIKESGAFAGVRHSSGCRVLANYKAEANSEIIHRYKQAGLIIFGKTNMSEFGLLPTAESKLFGPCRNPWNLGYSPGGSSGGAAAAVAAGIVPAAHGADGGGSIRIPAACCGLFGLKPTRARTPKGPAVGDSISGLVIDHVISRTVRDSAALLDVTAGAALGDPYWAPPQKRPFLQEVNTPPGKLKIGLMTKAFTGTAVHPDCVAAAENVAKLCADLGHEVEEVTLPINGQQFAKAFTVMWAAGCAWGVNGIVQLSGRAPTAEMYEPVTWGLYQMAQQHGSGNYLLAVQVMQQISRQIAHFFQDIDLLLTPTLAEPPLLLGSFDSTADNPMAGFDRAIEYVPFTPLANATGQPAMSVPLVWNDDNLPIGVQFMGQFGDEATLFRLAGQLEEARAWAGKRPLISMDTDKH